MKALVLGGIKSGKTRFAEQLAERLATECSGRVAIIATAQALDEEMADRIQRHQAARNPQWLTLEEPVHLSEALQTAASEADVVIVDCLTLWLTNLMSLTDSRQLQAELTAFEAVLVGLESDLVMVSNETNLGIIPLGELTRRYCDEAGLMHQRLARICDQVALVVAGLPLVLKGEQHGRDLMSGKKVSS